MNRGRPKGWKQTPEMKEERLAFKRQQLEEALVIAGILESCKNISNANLYSLQNEIRTLALRRVCNAV